VTGLECGVRGSRVAARVSVWVALAAGSLCSCGGVQDHPRAATGTRYDPREGDPTVLSAQTDPQAPWVEYAIRTIQHLPGYRPTTAEPGTWNRFGSSTTLDRQEARGFFYVKHAAGRWWLVDPDGYLALNRGVVHVGPSRSETSRAALAARFGSEAEWARHTATLLWAYGFNGTGAWSQAGFNTTVSRPVAYTRIWDFMAGYAEQRSHTGRAEFPANLIFVFDPAFEAWCDARARALAAVRDDPWLLGHFSDNELPFPADALDRSLQRLAAAEPGRQEAQRWLDARKGRAATAADVTDEDREAFRGHMADTYFRVTTGAMRRYDPNHLLLGSRLHSSVPDSDAVMRASGRYLDAVAVNHYGTWAPDLGRLRAWEARAGRPVLISEWYVMAADSGLRNTSGAGWIVRTQRDRGLFYQNFALALLESRVCVGWHWFRYMDNDPASPGADPSNRDGNKGIVTIRYEEYVPLLEEMRELNDQVYSLAAYFDGH
jgi:hypothetical protein